MIVGSIPDYLRSRGENEAAEYVERLEAVLAECTCRMHTLGYDSALFGFGSPEAQASIREANEIRERVRAALSRKEAGGG